MSISLDAEKEMLEKIKDAWEKKDLRMGERGIIKSNLERAIAERCLLEVERAVREYRKPQGSLLKTAVSDICMATYDRGVAEGELDAIVDFMLSKRPKAGGDEQET